MKNIRIIKAEKKHKEFILYANSEINNINSTDEENYLMQNIDKHLFSSSPLFHCFIAEIENKPVGMILYSYVYWANDGQVLWISQMYVEQEYRKYGVFSKLINKLKEENKDIHMICCATGNENERMNKILKGCGAKEIDLKFYYKEI